MNETNNVKDAIIRTTTELIQEYNGDATKITMRKISERVNVGLGLNNYHFGSKEQLIAIISILEDMHNYQLNSNSVNTQKGFSLAIKNDMDDKTRKLLSFVLTSAMQVTFCQEMPRKRFLDTISKLRKRCVYRYGGRFAN